MDGAVTRIERDAFGRPIAVTDALGAVTRMKWTTEGHLAARVDPLAHREEWTWDGEGNCLTYTDAKGSTTELEYTHFDKIAARRTPDGARYEFAYDTEMCLRRVTGPTGLTWEYERDAVGRLIRERDFDGRAETFAYDACGWLVSRNRPTGETLTFLRDETGNIVTKDAAGVLTQYRYDADGRLAEASTPTSTLRYERDAAGRVLAETVDGKTSQYRYDGLGQRIERTTPTGATGRQSFDAAGNRNRLDIGDWHLEFTHDRIGREITRMCGRTAMTSQWDPAGRLAGQTTAIPGRILSNRDYVYRADGHLTGIADPLAGSTESIDLDVLGRPLAVNTDNWHERYAYDQAGNQTEADWRQVPVADPAASGTREYEGTRLLGAGRVRYDYDAAGRTVLRQKTRLSRRPDTWRYEWDAEDRLVACTTPDGTRWTYSYDPLGRRTAKHRMTDDGHTVAETIRFTWDGTRLTEQHEEHTGITLTWDFEGHRPLTQYERKRLPQGEVDARFFAIATDLIGAPCELVSPEGELAWHAKATAWGATGWERTSTAYIPLRFPGQYHDPETGLHHNYFRHYDPETGRYVTPDPLGLAPAPNPVAYVINPQALTDTFGPAPCNLDHYSHDGSVRYHGLDEHGRPPVSPPPSTRTCCTPAPPRAGADHRVGAATATPSTRHADTSSRTVLAEQAKDTWPSTTWLPRPITRPTRPSSGTGSSRRSTTPSATTKPSSTTSSPSTRGPTPSPSASNTKPTEATASSSRRTSTTQQPAYAPPYRRPCTEL
jgi:RHS repeat-associated protein